MKLHRPGGGFIVQVVRPAHPWGATTTEVPLAAPAPEDHRVSLPVLLRLGTPGHGVARYAGEVAAWAGQRVVTHPDDVAPGKMP